MNDPALVPLQQAVDGLLARDLQALPDGLLLVSTEQLITIRSQLDGLISAQLQPPSNLGPGPSDRLRTPVSL